MNHRKPVKGITARDRMKGRGLESRIIGGTQGKGLLMQHIFACTILGASKNRYSRPHHAVLS